MSQDRTHSVPAPLAALVAWLVPGAGYLLIGQRARGLTVGITILTLFVMGLLIGGLRVVDPPDSYRQPLQAVYQRPWFVGQILVGPLTLVAASQARAVPYSHARVWEIGVLYTAVAGMLNLLAIIDTAYRATHGAGGET